jgi:hypothetical protein
VGIEGGADIGIGWAAFGDTLTPLPLQLPFSKAKRLSELAQALFLLLEQAEPSSETGGGTHGAALGGFTPKPDMNISLLGVTMIFSCSEDLFSETFSEVKSWKLLKLLVFLKRLWLSFRGLGGAADRKKPSGAVLSEISWLFLLDL